MAAKRRYRPRKSAIEIILLTLLWIILIPVILTVVGAIGAWTYLTLSGFSYDTVDDIAIIAAAAPMDAGERLVSVDAREGTFTIAADKSDVYWVATRENLLRPLAFDAEDAIEGFHFELDKYALQIEDGHVYVTARLLYRHFLYVPVRIEVLPGVRDGALVFYLKDIHIGEAVRVPLARFGVVTGEDGEPVYTLKDRLHPRMDSLRSASAEGEHLLLTFGLDPKDDLCAELLALDGAGRARCRYLDCDAAKIWREWAFDPAASGSTMKKALEQCAEKPSYLPHLKMQVLAVGTAHAEARFFQSRDADYQARFFPGGTAEDAAALRAALGAEAASRDGAISAVVRRLDEAYAARRITIGPGQVLLDGAPITVQKLMDADWDAYAGWFEESGVAYVLLDELAGRTAGSLPKTDGLPVLSRILTENGAAGKIGTNKRVALGMVFRLPSGAREMRYVTDAGLVETECVTEVFFDATMQKDALTHWPAGDSALLEAFAALAAEQGLPTLAAVETLVIPAGTIPLSGPEQAKTLAESMLRFLPCLCTLDLTEQGDLPEDVRSVLSGMLPTVALVFAGEAPAA